MPIFEYRCLDCGRISEFIIRSDTRVACEHCESTRMEKALSTFAAHSHATPELPPCAGGCGGFQQGQCGSGRCGLG